MSELPGTDIALNITLDNDIMMNESTDTLVGELLGNTSASTRVDDDARTLRNGYDIPVYGLDDGSFYLLHIPALVCIVSSFICAVISIVMAFHQWGARQFFHKWTKSQRFVVYVATCDALFNIFHFTDHLHIVIVQNMVHPKELCEFYGFNLIVAISAQNLMVNVVAVNAFMLLYFDRSINFGKRDWKLLLWTLVVPVTGAALAGVFGQLGPNGAYCHFDEVKGKITGMVFTAATSGVVLTINTFLYVLTWTKIYRQVHEVRKTLGTMPASMEASHKAARTMSMFVSAFFIQWFPLSVYSVWVLVDPNIPQALVHVTTIFSNIGGVLNLVVFVIIRRNQK